MPPPLTRYGLLICILLFCSGELGAQFTIQGRVLQASGRPIVNASLKIKDSLKGVIRYYALSDDSGHYRIHLPAGITQGLLECSFVGYASHRFYFKSVKSPSMILLHPIVMKEDTNQLEEVHVRASPPIRVSGDTTRFRTEAFRQGNESNISDLLNNLPGFLVENGRISYNGRTVNRVLVEGDDLFGRDYATLIQNLGPRGIDQVELIDHYKDRIYLSNRLDAGKELVVNLKFDKHFLYRISGSNELGTDPGLGRYFFRSNALSLIPKIKFVTTANLNNTGQLSSAIAGELSGPPAIAGLNRDAINFNSEEPYQVSPIASLQDISSPLAEKNLLVFNNTRFLSNNLVFKPSSRLQVKNILQLSADDYHQERNSKEDFRFAGNSFSVYNQQFLHKRLPAFHLANEIIYSPSSHVQFIYKLNYFSGREEDSSAEIRQTNIPIQYQLFNHNQGLKQSLSMSALADTNLLFDLQLMHNEQKSEQLPQVFPSGIYYALIADSSQKTALSQIEDNYSHTALNARLTLKKARSVYNWRILLCNTETEIHHQLSLQDSSSEKIVDRAGFLSDAYFGMRQVIGEMKFTTSISRVFTLEAGQKVEAGKLSLDNAGYSSIERHYANYLPSVDLTAYLTAKQRVNLQWAFKSALPDPYSVYAGTIIGADHSVTSGIHELNNAVSDRVTLAYIFSDPVKSRLTAFTAISYSKDPVLYLVNTLPGIFYTVRKSISFPGTGKSLNLLGNGNKYVRAIRSQLDLMINSLWHNNFYSVGQTTGTFHLFNLNTRFRCKTLVTDRLITTLGYQHNYFQQQFDKGAPSSRTQQGHTSTGYAAVSWRIGNHVVFSAKYNRVYQVQQNENNQLQLAEVALKYNAKGEKMSIELTGNHLFSSGEVRNTGYSSVSSIVQSVDIQPSYLFLKFRFDF